MDRFGWWYWRCAHSQAWATVVVGGLLAVPALLVTAPLYLPPDGGWAETWAAEAGLWLAAASVLVLAYRAAAPWRATAFDRELHWLIRAAARWVACCLLPLLLACIGLALSRQPHLAHALRSGWWQADQLRRLCFLAQLTAPVSCAALLLLSPAAARGDSVRGAYALVTIALPAAGSLLFGPYAVVLIAFGSPVLALQWLFATYALPEPRHRARPVSSGGPGRGR